MTNTLLFGGSGFLGPIILGRYPEIISTGRTPIQEGLRNHHIPFENVDDLSPLDDVDFDKVIFLIGNSNHHRINQHPTMGLEYNVLPLTKTLHYLKDRNLKKFIAFTGALLYDAEKITLPVDESQALNPHVNPYIFSKFMAEETTKLFPQIPSINVRLSNIYGPTRLIRPDFVPTLVQDALSPNQPQVWNTSPKRDFIYAPDAADAIISLLDTDYTGPINLGSGKMNSCGRVVEILESLSGKKVEILDIPVKGPMQFQYDISLVSRLTGWQPQSSLEQGLSETYHTMREYASECRWWDQKDE
tara:strand:- start:2753 stop:3658 length:906 start_codon:yes stop_codon:yes gene_type:complete